MKNYPSKIGGTFAAVCIRYWPRINVEFNEKKILNAIKKVYSTNYLKILRKSSNPYEKKNSSDKILKILQRIDLMKIKTKAFFDYKLSWAIT